METDKRKVSAEEVERLFRFTRQHFVEHYDLQAELADHLANAIEERWQQHPELSFEDALTAEFKKFGIFGFSDIVEKRQNALTKKYYKLLWGYFKNFLRLPQVVVSIAAVVVIYFLLGLSAYIYSALLFIVMVFSLVRLFKIKKMYHKKTQSTGRRWLLEDIIFSCGGIGPMLYLPMQINLHMEGYYLSEPIRWGLAVFIVVVVLLEYAALYILPHNAQKHLAETYPEYRLLQQ